MNIKNSSFLLALLLLSFTLVLISIFIPQQLDHRAETFQLKLGLPFKYLIQEQYTGTIGLPEGPRLPYGLVFSSPWENPTKILWLPMILDVGLVYLILSLILGIGNRILIKRR